MIAMDDIIAQIQTLAENADETGRNSLQIALRDLQYRLETPQDTLMRLYNSNLQLAVIYVGVELGLFRELAKNDNSVLTATELSEILGASPDLLARLLRYLSSVGCMINVGPNEFRANKVTHALAEQTTDAIVYHIFNTCGPAIQAFPSFLAETNYQDITNDTATPFQKGFNTELSCFQYLAQQPKQFAALQKVMTALQSSDWTAGFELFDRQARDIQLSKTFSTERPFLVDVGGGHGHQCVQLLKKYPKLHGHLVVQDLERAVDKLPPLDGVDAMAQNFFEEQAIKGAHFYYLRRILHDWHDTSCVKILQNLAAAMRNESRILVDEVILPDVSVHWHAAMGDISMGIQSAGRERTRREWESLVKKAGLRLEHVHTYGVTLYNSILVLGLPEIH